MLKKIPLSYHDCDLTFVVGLGELECICSSVILYLIALEVLEWVQAASSPLGWQNGCRTCVDFCVIEKRHARQERQYIAR